MEDHRLNVGGSLRKKSRTLVLSGLLVWVPVSAAAQSATAPSSTPRSNAASSNAARSNSTTDSKDPKRAQARSYAMAAFVALDGGAYPEAIAQFTSGLDLLDVPTLRVGRAEALFQVGKWLEAKADYEAALSYALKPEDSATFSESQAIARDKLGSLEPRIPALRIQSTAEYVDVNVDEASAVRLSTGERLAINPGAHRVVISTPDGSLTHSIQAKEGEVLTLDGPKSSPALPKPSSGPSLASGDSPTPLSDTRAERGTNTALIVSASITGALAIGTVVASFVFFDAKSDYNRANSDLTGSESRRNELKSRAETIRLLTAGLAGLTVAAAGVTTYFWLAPRLESDEVAQLHSPPSWTALDPTRVWVGARGTF